MGNFLPFLFIAVYQLLQKRNSKTPRKGHLYPEKWAVFSYKEMRALSRESTRPAGTALHQASLRRDGIWHKAKKGGVVSGRGACVGESTSEDSPHTALTYFTGRVPAALPLPLSASLKSLTKLQAVIAPFPA